jgi:tetratricopeptide (TPR) repeat protein
MTDREQEALHLIEVALQRMWQGEVDAAIELYDRAAAAAESEVTRELITIRKAEALIAANREGPELSALPGIVMRRRTPRHVYIAAYALARRFLDNEDRKRALMYGQIACAAAMELDEPMPKASVLNALGITLVADSQFALAIEALEEALVVLAPLEANEQRRSLRAAVLANLGGANVLHGKAAEGVRHLETALPDLDDPYDRAEAFLDLCFGWMELGDNETAERYGRAALELASIPRQIRNANHLLGEICVRMSRHDEADAWFDVVASFYPDFRNVKQLLVAVDLCSVVNWKA